jgi:tetratricopeptide (TPR) repeat protein
MARPTSEPDYWDRVEAAFADALAAEDSARASVLDAHCGRRADLRAEVEALLSAHARAGEFINPPTSGVTRGETGGCLPGMRVGPFRLIERVAHGGMGDVYRAERVEGEFTQQVAIKLIADKLHGADTVRRFRAERQILASLQHPNIVTLVDGGVMDDGHPYIVMEYVDGLPLTEFCRRHSTLLRERLRLFQQVCSAVSFAHRHLVVHRDLKPSNVLVTTDGVVKVLDFGVAKLLTTQDGPAAATLALVGPLTPNYASPEQVRGLPVTTAADVYSLGVMLYELLSGGRPYETSGKTVDEIMTIVLEREPSRPSAARADGTPYDPRRLRGDLDAIILKAMAKDPRRRYGSVDELHADVAREPSLFYVARKAMMRHRAAFSVAAIFLVLLVAALIGALAQARIAERQAALAAHRFQEVRQLARYVIYDLQDGISRLAGATELRRGMVQKSLQYLDSLAAEAGGDEALLLEIAGAYHKLGDVLGNPGVANLGDSDGAGAAYDKAESLYRAVLKGQSAQAEPQRALARLLLAESDFHGLLGATPRAERALFESRAIWESLARSDAQNAANLEGLASVELASYVRADRPRSADAMSHLQRALAIYQKLSDADPSNLERMRNVSVCHRHLVTFYLSRKEDATALAHARIAADIDARRLARDPHDAMAKVDYAIVLSQLGVCNRRLGFQEEALKFYLQSLSIRRDLWESDRANVFARDRLMYLLTEVGSFAATLKRWHEARGHVLEAIEHAAALHGKVSNTVPQETLIQGYFQLGRIARELQEDPCPLFRKCVALAPVTAEATAALQYRVAVTTALQSAREGLNACAR